MLLSYLTLHYIAVQSFQDDECDQIGDHGHGTTTSPSASPSALTQQFSFGKTPKSLPMNNKKLLVSILFCVTFLLHWYFDKEAKVPKIQFIGE